MNNLVILEGNVGKDPEVRFTQSGSKVVTYSLAVFRPTKDKDNPATVWFNIVCWGDQANSVEQNVHKGTRLEVKGRLQTRNYDDKDGKKVYVTEVLQNEYHLAPQKVEKEETGSLTYDESELPF